MTTSKDGEGLAPSAIPAPADPRNAQAAFFATVYKWSEWFIASQLAFPVLLLLFALDWLYRPPQNWQDVGTVGSQGIFLLIGLLAVAGLCAEEYVGYLRTRGLKAPLSLGFYAALIPVLIATCWRPQSVPQVSLGLLTAVTIGLAFCILMVALSLIAEVSEKMARGLAVFCLACGGALIIGGALTHLLLLRQVLLGIPSAGQSALTTPLAVLLGGWVWAVATDFLRPKNAPLRLVIRYAGLTLAGIIVFWVVQATG